MFCAVTSRPSTTAFGALRKIMDRKIKIKIVKKINNNIDESNGTKKIDLGYGGSNRKKNKQCKKR